MSFYGKLNTYKKFVKEGEYEEMEINSSDDKSGRDLLDTEIYQTLQNTGSDSVRIRNYRAAVVCLVLLCVLLLIAVIVLGVTLTQERQQLISETENLTNEREQITYLINTGWKYYQSSFYYLSTEKKSWTESRRYCKERGADLIIINNREEQDFVKNMSVAAVYIGLTDIDEGIWEWVDGSTLTSGFSFWASGGNIIEPSGGADENCAMTVAVPRPEFANLVGWHDVTCNRAFQWICEKRIEQFTPP